jgi:hypothetical protein
MVTTKITYEDVKKGLIVRRGGNPKTPQGKARKAETFTVTRVYGHPGKGFCEARLEGHGRAFRVYAVHLVEKWERACL